MKRDFAVGRLCLLSDFCPALLSHRNACRFRGRGAALADEGIPLLVSISGCLRYPAAYWCGAADGCGSAPL